VAKSRASRFSSGATSRSIAGLGTPLSSLRGSLIYQRTSFNVAGMRERIAFHVPLQACNKKETMEIIDSTLKGTRVTFNRDIKENIYDFTLGHPYEFQVLCSNLYESQLQGKVGKDEWDQAFKNSLWELGRDYFEALHRKASEREEAVLLTLARAKSALSTSETMERVDDEHDNFPLKNVKNFLYRLENKGLIRKIHRKGFCVIDPMFREYILLKSDIR
jgi:hypothetical protein